MDGMALGRKVLETGESFQLKEVQYPYIAHFGAKKSEIGTQNTHVWSKNQENTTPYLGPSLRIITICCCGCPLEYQKFACYLGHYLEIFLNITGILAILRINPRILEY
jgi:hypothetical protein